MSDLAIRLCPLEAEEHAVLASLFELYVYDFSELLDVDVGDDGRFRIPSLAAYGTDPRCHAFLIRANERWAGFALAQQRSRLSGDPSVSDVAEFFVLRRYRRRGVGERAAHLLFDRFPGVWEVRERRENVAAIAFWRRAITRYVDGPFEDFELDDDRWRGQVQRFRAAR